MTATDELRRLLDERGVEWDYGITGATTTRFNANGVDLTFTPMRDGIVCSTILTPEQAIEATLGATDAKPTRAESSGTCHKVRVHEEIEDEMHCSECGRFLGFAGDIGAPPYNYCPNCGRKVVDE